MADEYENVRFVVEDLGNSPMADRFGVDKYPALFVDDALVARPEDFYSWGGPETGRYLPWSEIGNRRRFQQDVRRMIEMRMRGESIESLTASNGSAGSRPLPDRMLTDIDGATFRLSDMRGKPLIVEMWATWCPPCLQTLSWMKELDSSKVQIVGVAIESKREDVEAVMKRIDPPGRIVMGDADLIEAFGGLPAVPAMFIADRDGRIVKMIVGAPPDLHEIIEREIGLLSR